MSTGSISLIVLAVLVVLYVMRRKARLDREAREN
jgi:heme exporter protein D